MSNINSQTVRWKHAEKEMGMRTLDVEIIASNAAVMSQTENFAVLVRELCADYLRTEAENKALRERLELTDGVIAAARNAAGIYEEQERYSPSMETLAEALKAYEAHHSGEGGGGEE